MSDHEVRQTDDGCRIENFNLHSPAMGRDIGVVVVLPPNHEQHAPLPVLYALHGMGAPYAAWSEMPPLRRQLAEQPMLVVSFDGDRAGAYLDATEKPDSQFTTFFFDELVPFIDEHYPTNGLRGVTGFSMGGFGAVHYMLTKPDAFASVSALSGAFDWYLGGPDGEPSDSLEALLGPPADNPGAYDAISIRRRVQARIDAGEPLPPIMLHCGSDDFLLDDNRALADFLAAQNRAIRERLEARAGEDADGRAVTEQWARERIDYVYKESPGGHNWPFWRDASAAIVDFHWRTFQNAGVDR
ncbi:MAG: alpha/beta hydrolase family protein [Phycisphaeraceae bacterium]